MNIGERKGKDGKKIQMKYSFENVLMKLVIVDNGCTQIPMHTLKKNENHLLGDVVRSCGRSLHIPRLTSRVYKSPEL